MSFTAGNFDFIAQVEPSAVEVVTHVLYETLRRQGKTRFQRTVASGLFAGTTIEFDLTDLKVPRVASLNLSDRFAAGNTVATFEVDARFILTVQVFGAAPSIQDTIDVLVKDLQIDLYAAGGFLSGVALGFARFDIDITGLQVLRALSAPLNLLADFVALVIRTVLTPLGMIPIPIAQLADAYRKVGMLFDGQGSPYLGTTSTGTGLYLAADFQASNNAPGVIGAVQDILPSGNVMNVGAVVSDRMVNQLIGMLLATNQLPNSLPSPLGTFRVQFAAASFLDRNPAAPAQRPGRVAVDAEAAARVRVSKGGFFGSLFGLTRKVTVHVGASLTVDTGIVVPQPSAAAIIDFGFQAQLRARVTIYSVLIGVLTVLFGPFLVIFLFLLSQLLNFFIDFFLPLQLSFNTAGSGATAMFLITIDKLAVQLGLGSPSLTSATLKVRADAAGNGSFELEHFVQHLIQTNQVPLGVDWSPQGLLTREIASQPHQGELFLGAKPHM